MGSHHLGKYGELVRGRVPFDNSAKFLGIGEHLLYFNDLTTQLGRDGYFEHQSPGVILNDAKLKYLRRVWAQGKIDVIKPVQLGREYKCQERLQFIKRVRGDHYVCIERLVSGIDDETVLRETRTLAYTNSLAKDRSVIALDSSNGMVLGSFTFREMDIVMYGQLSLNPHRIHWDYGYSRQIEGYMGIIVQGPFALQILMGFVQSHVKKPIQQVKYRNYNYIYPDTKVEILLRESVGGYEVWMRDSEKHDIVYLKADATC